MLADPGLILQICLNYFGEADLGGIVLQHLALHLNSNILPVDRSWSLLPGLILRISDG